MTFHCTDSSGHHLETQPDTNLEGQQVVTIWAQTTACCPECQVTPTVPCHDDGRARTTVHNRRQQEAEETAA